MVFISDYMDGLQVFNMSDPTDPQTVAFFDTYLGSLNADNPGFMRGAFGMDVRNEDAVIVVSDMTTGLWTFRMDSFQDGTARFGVSLTSRASRSGTRR